MSHRNLVDTPMSALAPREQQEKTATLGMIMFLGAWVIMFACLFFAYAMVRSRTSAWPPMDVPKLPIVLPGIATAIILLSSLVVHRAVLSARNGKRARIAPYLAATLALGGVFLTLQFVVWFDLYDSGLYPTTGSYASVFWGLTTIHAAHVLVGVFALMLLSISAVRGEYTHARYTSVRLWAVYWHFVGIVWAGMFVTVYLL